MIDAASGRSWALNTFGPDGARIREDIPRVLAGLHVRMADAQAASGMRSRGVYGQIYRGALEAFCAEFARLPNASTFVPAGANYHVPVVEGVAIFPWRFSATPAVAAETPIGISSARLDLFSPRTVAIEEELDLGIERPELDDEDLSFLKQRAAAVSEQLQREGRVVVVAFVSSYLQLHSIEWGDVQELTGDGLLRWGFHEQLATPVAEETPALSVDRGNFASGEAPRPIVEHRDSSTGDA